MDADLRVHTRSCTFCEAACGTLVTADHVAGQITGVRGDPDDPMSRGFVCPKSYALTELHADRDRLRKPLRRRARDFEEIGWAEAMDIAAERLGDIQKRHGRDSVGFYIGNPSGHRPGLVFYVSALLQALGSRQIYSTGTLDHFPKYVSAAYMFGGATIQPLADLDRTDYLIIIGNNPAVSQGSMLVAPGIRHRIEAIRARGGKVVLIDPRRTETAAIADEHVAVRPGTDAFLLMAMVHVIASEGLIDLGPVSGMTKNLELLAQTASRFKPEEVAEHTGIPAETIVRIAREMALAPSAAIYGRTGTCTQRFGTATSWLIDVLNTITGNLDRAGGNLFAPGVPLGILFQHNCRDGIFPVGRWHSRVKGLPEVMGMFPAAALADEMLTPGEGQVRGFITMAGNIVLSHPNGAKLQRAFDGLEFMLSLDIYLNETTRHADLIIPDPSYAEQSDFAAVTGYETPRNYTKWSAPVFDPPAGQPKDWEVLTGLAARLRDTTSEEIEEKFVRRVLSRAIKEGRPEARDMAIEDALDVIGSTPGPDRIFDILLRAGPYGDAFGAVPGGLNLERLKEHPHGLDLGPLEGGALPGMIATPDRMIDLAPSQIIADVPRMEAQLESISAPGSMLMIGRRDIRSKNAWMHNIHLLTKGKDRCTLLVNPADAQRLGLSSGSLARIRTQIAEIQAPVEVSDVVMPGVVSLPHGWGHDMADTRLRIANARPGVNANAILDESDVDVPSASSILNGVSVEIEPA